MKHLMQAAKWICTFLLLYFVFRNIDFSQTKNILYSKAGLYVLGITVLIFLLQTLLAGLRFKAILKIFDFNITAMHGIKLWFVGNFFGQILFSFVGADAMRLLSLARSGLPYGQSARAVFLDRVLGFVALQVLYFVGMYFLMDFLYPGLLRWSLIWLGIFSLVAIVMFFVLGCMPQRFHQIKYIGKILDLAAISRYLYTAKLNTIYILVISCLVHVCNIIAIYMIATLLGAEITLFKSFIIGIPVMYISMLPFSIGGWGLRENSMMIGFGLLGISSELALSVSIILGLSLLIASIPGAVVFWERGARVKDKEALSINDATANI